MVDYLLKKYIKIINFQIEYRREVEDELRSKSNQSHYNKDIYEKEHYIIELEGSMKDLKTFLTEYKKMNDDKDYEIKQRDNEIENLKHKVLQLDNKLKLYEDNELAKQRIIDLEVDKEKLKNKEIVERFNQKFTFFEEQISVLENQLHEKNRYILELEVSNKDINFIQTLVEEKQILIESLRRENQELMRRIREQFRDSNFGLEKFDLQEEKKFVQDIIKKKEEQGLFADGFISHQRNEQAISDHIKRKQNLESNKDYRNDQIKTLAQYQSQLATTEQQKSQNKNDYPYSNSQTQQRGFQQLSEEEKEEIRRKQERLEQRKYNYS